MGWLNKIFKGSTHKILEGHNHGEYGNDKDALSDFAKEDIDHAIALSLSKEEQKEDVSDNETPRHSYVEEDEQFARALQESLNFESPPREYGRIYQPTPFPFVIGFRICAGCNNEIHGRYLSCMDAVWHPECFCCNACKLPISDYEFSMHGNKPYHKSCYKELYHPRCDACNQFIPTNSFGLIEYRAHPFWQQKYCPSHEHDGTPRCCSCERMEGIHQHLPETRGLCLSEEQTVSTILRRPIFGFGNRIVEMMTEPYKLIRHCEVTAILVLYGLPRLLTGSILAHEMMHAWLRLNGYPTLHPRVEEGICQVLGHMWLDSEIFSGSGSHIASSSSSSSSSTSSKKGTRSQFERRLGDFFKYQIESDTSSAYGDGFRAGNRAVIRYGLRQTLDHIKLTGSFPY